MSLYILKFGWVMDRVRNFMKNFSVKALVSDECDGKVLVAVSPDIGKVVGYILIKHWRENIWEESDLLVHPNFRRQGIGSRLVSAALSYVKNKKGKEVFAAVNINDLVALNFHKKQGFNFHQSRALIQYKL